MGSSRIENLDTLRSAAILMVLAFHSIQLFADHWPRIWQFAQAGAFGVDLFFALSGYLIGSLFFMEKRSTGGVSIGRFILRRISRTVPPYFVALLLSYLAVYFYRAEPFSIGYLFFAQNYYHEIPFFFISWSLCVEEHFYLILPVLLSLLFKAFNKPKLMFVVVLFSMSLIPLVLRIAYQQIDPKPFGFYQTATHLNFDPLILGVMYAYLSTYFKFVLTTLLRFKTFIYLTTVLLLLSYSWWPNEWMYSVGAYIIGLFFATAVAVSCEDKCWSVSKVTFMPVLATASYAIYLTHVLTTHALEKIFTWMDFDSIVIQLSLIMLIACLVGYLFYKLVEKPIMRWRLKTIPSYRRTNQGTDYANKQH